MIEVLLLAGAFLAGIELRKLLLLSAAAFAPAACLAVAAVLLWNARRSETGQPALFCDAVAAELRSGASLRSALAISAESVGVADLADVARSAAPVAEIAEECSRAFGTVGDELALTIRSAGRRGSGSADIFTEIGTLALAQSEVDREIRVATAPARATAAVFVIAPTVFLLFQARSGALATLLAGPAQRTAGLIGLGLFLAGTATASLIFRKTK